MLKFFAPLCFFFLAGTAYAQVNAAIPPDAGICDRIYADVASQLSELRDVMDRCDFDTDAFALALHKLNRLAPPSDIKRIALRSRTSTGAVVRRSYEMDVFFLLFEAYPHPLAFGKLGELTDKMSEGFEIERIEITGSSDPLERELPEMKLGARRAEFLQRYFVMAGVSAERIRITDRAPSHADNPEGRARDRSAEIKVFILRETPPKNL